MKKTIKIFAAALLILVMITALTSCFGGGQQTEPPVTEPPVTEPQDKTSCKIVNNEVLAYDEQGTRINYNNEFLEHKGNTYYVVNNFVVTGFYIVENNVYYFNEYGVKQNVNINEVFVEFNGSVYYSVNNTIVFNTVVINGAIYDFGDEGKMVTGAKGDYVYGEDGKLIANESFVTLNGDVYYVINNTIVYNMIIIDGAIYNFGDDGKMIVGEHGDYFYGEDGRLLGEDIFVNIKGDIYYLIGDRIVYNQIIIDGFVYNFGDDGKMIVGEKDGHKYGADGKLIGDKLFIAINGDIYYIINNMIIYNEYIINGYVYNFGEDGKMITGEHDGRLYGEDGRLVADKLFITINGDVYYIINNTIVYNMIVIDGYVYNFGLDGKMITGTYGGYNYDEEGRLVANEIFITVNGDVYYIVNNMIVINQIVVIDGYIYKFDENGHPVTGEHGGRTYDEFGRLVANEIFIVINGDVYYIINNTIVYNQIIIDGYVYNFGDDGKMITGEYGGFTYDEEGPMIGNRIFVTVNGKVYYLIYNTIVVNVYVIHEGRVYYFTSTGERLENAELDGYVFGADGYITNDSSIVINGVTYIITGGYADEYVDEEVETTTITGTIYESDNDFTLENNDKLANVDVTLEIGGERYTTTSDENGYFEFVDVVQGEEGTLTFVRNGYITATTTVNGSEEDLTIVMDKQVSNNLVGTVLIADADSTLTNNSPLSGALITLERTSSTNTFRYETTTSSNGYYSFTGLTAGVYTLTVEKEGYITVSQTVQVRYNETTVNNVAIEAIPDAVDEEGYASGYITEALRGTGVEGLTVYIYEGINTTFGTPVEILTTNSSGYYATSALKPGNYTAYVVDERELEDEDYRYSSVAISLKVLPGVTSANQNATVANSVGLDIDGMRIVLTWGSSPRDLDSHLTYGNYHVYYSNKNTPNANLDWDDTSAYGPETVTITDMGNYTFKYYIYNYSRSGTMYASQACIRVYFGNSTTPAYTFYPPQGSGYYWDVFTYNALTGEFTILNTLR